jgi:DNA-binding CsgD family transcriptional regulator
MNDNLVDRIYETPFFPELWPGVLSDLSTTSGGISGELFTVSTDHKSSWTASPIMVPLMRKFVEGGYGQGNTRVIRAAERRYSGFIADIDLMTQAEIDRDPIYMEILRPAGIGWTAGTTIPIPTGDMLVFGFERSIHAGPHDRPALDILDRFRPHLARAGLLSARLAMKRAQTAADTMERLGLAAVAVGLHGQAVAVNSLFGQAMPHIQIGARNLINIADARAAQLLGDSMDLVRTGQHGIASIPIAGSEGAPATVLHVLPIKRDARDLFQNSLVLLVATPIGSSQVPPGGLLAGLFDLSPAEDRLARGLVGGMSVQECAAAFGVSPETIRSQIKSIFAKTGTTRQSDLVQLLSGSTSVPIRADTGGS